MSVLATFRKFQFIAGNLALDFCNTVGGKRGVVAREYLDSYTELAAWAQQAGIVSMAEAEKALQMAARRPEAAASALARAIELREALFRIFAALLEGNLARESDLAILNAELARSLCRLRQTAANGAGMRPSSATTSTARVGGREHLDARMTRTGPRPGRAHSDTAARPGEALVWEWSSEEPALEQPLGPVAYAAAKVLTDGAALARVRICQGDTCGWVFIDASKNHSRCWCDMRDCGNRAKVRRHRQKQRRREPGHLTRPNEL